MSIGTISGVLYFVISAMFAYNFSVIFQRIHSGSTKVNRHSLFATSSLVTIFFTEALSHFGWGAEWVLLAQSYLLWTMLYIVFSKRNEKEEKA